MSINDIILVHREYPRTTSAYYREGADNCLVCDKHTDLQLYKAFLHWPVCDEHLPYMHNWLTAPSMYSWVSFKAGTVRVYGIGNSPYGDEQNMLDLMYGNWPDCIQAIDAVTYRYYYNWALYELYNLDDGLNWKHYIVCMSSDDKLDIWNAWKRQEGLNY